MKKSYLYNVEMFFQHTNPRNAVSNTLEFSEYYNRLDKVGKNRLKTFFHNIKMRAYVCISPITYETEKGVRYVYVNIKYRSGGGLNFTMICFPGFETFRDILINNIIDIELDDLLKECESHNKEEK